MEALLWVVAILTSIAANFVAARQRNPLVGRIVLAGTIVPALALVVYAGGGLLYAIVNGAEVNARFAAGDLTYFGADIAFVATLALAALWTALAYAGFRAGRARRLQA